LDELKVMHENLYMTEYVDACQVAVPELIAEIERIREIVREAVSEADAEMDGLAWWASENISVKRDALKRLAERLGVDVGEVR
jgi:hypothetical protein